MRQQSDGQVLYRTVPEAASDADHNAFHLVLRNLFNIDRVSLVDLYAEFSKRDARFAEVSPNFPGIATMESILFIYLLILFFLKMQNFGLCFDFDFVLNLLS
jgi:hypothetical protein